MSDADHDVENRTRELAYRLWEQDGCQHGRAEHYWLMANAQVSTVGPAADTFLPSDVEPVPATVGPITALADPAPSTPPKKAAKASKPAGSPPAKRSGKPRA